MRPPGPGTGDLPEAPLPRKEDVELVKQLLQHSEVPEWRRLHNQHFPVLLGYYNVSLKGK